MKTIQLMPGVVTANEFSSLMYVRGGSFYETSSFIDGMFLINPYMWGGVTSVFNPSMIDSIEFYSGGFPAKYGQAMSGVLDVEVRNGCATNTKGFLDISMTTFEGLIEGPLGSDGESSFIVSVRRTYYDLIAKIFVGDDVHEGNKFPFFYNLHSKFHIKLGKKSFLDFGTLLTYEGMDWKFTADEAADSPDIHEDSEFHYKDKTVMQSVRLKSALSDKLAFSSMAGYKLRTGDYKFVDISTPMQMDNTMNELQTRGDLDWKLNKKISIDTGVYYHMAWWNSTFTSSERTLIEQTTNTNAVYFVTNRSFSMDNETWVYFGGYASARIKPVKGIRVEAGGRMEYFNVTEDLIFSPRGSLLVELGKNTRLKAATGLYQQYPFYVGDGMALNDKYGNQDLLAERARHYVAGFEQDFGKNIMFRVEGFYKYYDRVVVEDHLKNYVNGAERRAYGFDVFLQKKISGWIDGWITYSYIKVEDRITDRSAAVAGMPDYEMPEGEWFSPIHDKKHNLSLVLNFRLGKRWTLGFTFKYSTGAPYTPLVGRTEQNDGGTSVWVPEWGKYNSARLPDYSRLDVKLSYHYKKFTTYLQACNVLNHENVDGISWSDDYSTENKTKGLPFFAVLGFKFEF